MAETTGDSLKSDEKERKPDIVAKFVCCMCSKTFYNSVALQNHKNMHHDLDEVKEIDSKPPQNRSSETHFADPSETYTDNFVFIPLQEEADAGVFVQDDGLPAKVFSEDTTYVVVRLADDEGDVDAAKRRRLEGLLQRTRKPPVVIRVN